VHDYFSAYHQYTAQTESPTRFHFWSAVSAVATMVSKNIWLDNGAFTTYPNHYIVLVSGSAEARKSAASGLATGLVADVVSQQVRSGMGAGLPFGVQNATYQSLVSVMSGKGGGNIEDMPDVGELGSRPVLLEFDELTMAMPSSGAGDDLANMLTELYTWPKGRTWTKITKTQGWDSIQSPCLNMLACTQLKRIADSISPSTFAGGFVGRCVFVYEASRRHKDAWPELDQKAKEFVQNILYQLTMLDTGPIEMDSIAKALYTDWYNSLGDEEDDSGFRARQHAHVQKLALILALSDLRTSVGPHDIERAIAEIERVRIDLPAIFRFIRYADERPGMRLVEGLIQQAGENGFKHSSLLKAVVRHLKSADLADVITDLTSAGNITEVIVDNGKAGRKPKVYIHREFVE
jgi:hypothetical protein